MEPAFNTTIGWFNVAASKFGTSNRQQVLLDQPFNKGASNNGYGSAIHVDGQVSNSNVATAGPIVSMLWMKDLRAELAPIRFRCSPGCWPVSSRRGRQLP